MHITPQTVTSQQTLFNSKAASEKGGDGTPKNAYATHASAAIKNNEATPTREIIAGQKAGLSGSIISSETATTLLKLQESEDEESVNTPIMNTSKGYVELDLDEYFADDPKVADNVRLTDIPLLLPSADNIKALSEHATARFKQMMFDYNIPEAPEKITYDQAGKMQLPADYPYAEELKQALEENPGLARELSTVNALTSHFVEIQKRMPMMEELQNAGSQAEIDLILAKYSYLLQDNGNYSNIALTFSKDGSLGISADGKSVKLA